MGLNPQMAGPLLGQRDKPDETQHACTTNMLVT
jgi:hypothetical protein